MQRNRAQVCESYEAPSEKFEAQKLARTEACEDVQALQWSWQTIHLGILRCQNREV